MFCVIHLKLCVCMYVCTISLFFASSSTIVQHNDGPTSSHYPAMQVIGSGPGSLTQLLLSFAVPICIARLMAAHLMHGPHAAESHGGLMNSRSQRCVVSCDVSRPSKATAAEAVRCVFVSSLRCSHVTRAAPANVTVTPM